MGLPLLFGLLLISCTVLAANGQYNDEPMFDEESPQHGFGGNPAAGEAELPVPIGTIGESNVRKRSPSEPTEVGLKARHASKMSHRPADESSTIRVFRGPHHANNGNYGLHRTNIKRVEANGRVSHRQGGRDAVGDGQGRSSGRTSGDRGGNRDVFSGTRRRSHNDQTERTYTK